MISRRSLFVRFVLVVVFLPFIPATTASTRSSRQSRSPISSSDAPTIPFRPPAIPLIVQDPYISIWSNGTDNLLHADHTRHWNGDPVPFLGLLSIENADLAPFASSTPSEGPRRCFRFLGVSTNRQDDPATPCAPMQQTKAVVNATNSYFFFVQKLAAGEQLHVSVQFTTPSFMTDMSGQSDHDEKGADGGEETFSAELMVNVPVSYVTVRARVVSSLSELARSRISVYLEHGADVVVNRAAELVEWGDHSSEDDNTNASVNTSSTSAARIGAVDQTFFKNSSYDDRVNWGVMHDVVVAGAGKVGVASRRCARQVFLDAASGRGGGQEEEGGVLDDCSAPLLSPRPAGAFNDLDAPVIATIWSADLVVGSDDQMSSIEDTSSTTSGNSKIAVFRLMLGFEERVGMRFFGEPLAPFWTHRFGADFRNLLAYFATQHNLLVEEVSQRFDETVVSHRALASIPASEKSKQTALKYDRLASLVYRQVTGALKAVLNPQKAMPDSAKHPKPWLFLKEISSDGDVNTVDVLRS